jgi:hypothetical protein
MVPATWHPAQSAKIAGAAASPVASAISSRALAVRWVTRAETRSRSVTASRAVRTRARRSSSSTNADTPELRAWMATGSTSGNASHSRNIRPPIAVAVRSNRWIKLPLRCPVRNVRKSSRLRTVVSSTPMKPAVAYRSTPRTLPSPPPLTSSPYASTPPTASSSAPASPYADAGWPVTRDTTALAGLFREAPLDGRAEQHPAQPSFERARIDPGPEQHLARLEPTHLGARGLLSAGPPPCTSERAGGGVEQRDAEAVPWGPSRHRGQVVRRTLLELGGVER